MTKRTLVLVLVASLALAAPVTASASDASLVSALVSWSKKIGKDSKRQSAVSARKASTAAQVKAATRRVLNDAVAARKALAREQPSTAKGARVKTLSVRAFRLFAQGERELIASLDAASTGDIAGAGKHAGNAIRIVSRAAQVLLQAGTLADEL
jgi:hypothetical protein